VVENNEQERLAVQLESLKRGPESDSDFFVKVRDEWLLTRSQVLKLSDSYQRGEMCGRLNEWQGLFAMFASAFPPGISDAYKDFLKRSFNFYGVRFPRAWVE